MWEPGPGSSPSPRRPLGRGHGGVETLGRKMRFDLILANLDGKNLRSLIGTLPTLFTPGGRAICSGILVEEEAGITAAIRAARLQVVARRGEREWLCFTLARVAFS